MTNMYPDTVTINPLHGKCPHPCRNTYCYVPKIAKAMGISDRYEGPPRLNLKAFDSLSKNGKPKMVFVCSMNDLFAEIVPSFMIRNVLATAKHKPVHTYLFQTKNPSRFHEFYFLYPRDTILGTTIESDDRVDAIPRSTALGSLSEFETMVSIEPIMDFNPRSFTNLIAKAKPNYVSIGADSGNNNLVEPSSEKLVLLIRALSHGAIEVRLKKNLYRLLDEASIKAINEIQPPVIWQEK